MFDTWQNHPILRRADGSYVIAHGGYPEYHVPDNQKFHNWWMEIDAYAQEHPDQVTDEPAPPVPTEAELLARAKTLKTAEFDRAMADIDAELIRSTTDLVAAMLTPEAVPADGDDTSAAELEHSKNIFAKLRGIQGQNRALRAQVEAAETVEQVQAIEPVKVDTATLGERRDDTRATSF